MIYKAGWLSSVESALPIFHSLKEVGERYPEIFLGEDEDPTTKEWSEAAMFADVVKVNEEGNYHEFLFRPAFAFEVEEATRSTDSNIRMVDVRYHVRGALHTTVKVPANLLFAVNDVTLREEASAEAYSKLTDYFSEHLPSLGGWDDADIDDETWEEVK